MRLTHRVVKGFTFGAFVMAFSSFALADGVVPNTLLVKNITDLRQLPVKKKEVDAREVMIDFPALIKANPDDLKRLTGRTVVFGAPPDHELTFDDYTKLGIKVMTFSAPAHIRFENISVPGVRATLDGMIRAQSALPKNPRMFSDATIIDVPNALNKKDFTLFLRANPKVKAVKAEADGDMQAVMRDSGRIVLFRMPKVEAIPTPVNGQITDSVADKPPA